MEPLRAGSYEVLELTVTAGTPVALPEGARVLTAMHTMDGKYRLLVRVPEAKPLNEGTTKARTVRQPERKT